MENLTSFINKNTNNLKATTGCRFLRYQDKQECIIRKVIPENVGEPLYYRVYYYKESMPERELWCDHNSLNGQLHTMLEKRKTSRQWKRRD